MPGVYWKTKDGQVIDVDDMSESHVRNVLKMLIRKNMISKPERDSKWDHLYYDYLEKSQQEEYPVFDRCWL